MARKTFKLKKKQSLIQFVSNLDARTNYSYVMNTCRILKNAWIKSNHNNSMKPAELSNKINECLDKIAPINVPTEDVVNNCQIRVQRKNETILNTLFSFNEFNSVLETRNNKSSPGMDGIDYCLIKRITIKI